MIQVQVKGVDEVAGKLNLLANGIINEIKNSATEIGAKGASLMKAEAPEATGALKESVAWEVYESTGTNTEIHIIPEAEYAIYLEKGTTGGGMPPADKIRAWMQAKGLAATPKDVYFVSRKISNSGIQANPFVARARHQLEGVLSAVAVRNIITAVRRVFA